MQLPPSSVCTPCQCELHYNWPRCMFKTWFWCQCTDKIKLSGRVLLRMYRQWKWFLRICWLQFKEFSFYSTVFKQQFRKSRGKYCSIDEIFQGFQILLNICFSWAERFFLFFYWRTFWKIEEFDIFLSLKLQLTWGTNQIWFLWSAD